MARSMKWVLMILLMGCSSALQAAFNKRIVPKSIESCLAQREIQGKGSLWTQVNPYCLRGDFVLGDWTVISNHEAVMRMKNQPGGMRPKGEVILMAWDDGNGALYFDGAQHRWQSIR